MFCYPSIQRHFTGDSAVKNPPTMQETPGTQFQSLGREDPLEEIWQPTPIFLPGQPYVQRTLVGCSPCGLKELDMTEATEHAHMQSGKNICYLFLTYLMPSLSLHFCS